MKTQNRVSQLTLELYHRDLATRKERKQVEKALLADASVRERYERLKETEREIHSQFAEEMRRLNIPETPPLQASHGVNVVWGLIVAAAVFVCALVPVVLHLKNNSAKKGNAVAENQTESPIEEAVPETETLEIVITPNTTIENDKTPPPTQPVKEKGASNEKPKVAVNPQSVPTVKEEFEPETGSATVTISAATNTMLRMRGSQGQTNDQGDAFELIEQSPDDVIPPGITFIFENMFANKSLIGIYIPPRIKSIAKNAYAGNPALLVTISADVDVHEDAIPGNFAKAYNAQGKAGGVYRRPDAESEEWEKQ